MRSSRFGGRNIGLRLRVLRGRRSGVGVLDAYLPLIGLGDIQSRLRNRYLFEGGGGGLTGGVHLRLRRGHIILRLRRL